MSARGSACARVKVARQRRPSRASPCFAWTTRYARTESLPPAVPSMPRLLLLALSLVSCTAPALRAQGLSAEELQRATAHLEQKRAAFIASLKGLSEAQWNFKPAPTRWSVAEVAEHIAAAEDLLRGNVTDQVLQAPARTEPADVKALDDLVLTVIADRTHKAQAPEPLVPTRRFGGVPKTVEHFTESRAKTLAVLTDQANDLRAHAVDSPLGKPLDAYQWLLFISAHCERHTKQIEEVKADPNFPST